MEGSGSSYNSQGGGDVLMPPSGGRLEALQKEHEEKIERIQQLKKDIELVKNRLQQRKKKEIPEEQLRAIKALTDKYDTMREEYNALLAHKSSVLSSGNSGD